MDGIGGNGERRQLRRVERRQRQAIVPRAASLLGGEAGDPAEIESELVRLRDDCAALVHELEDRYERVMRVPRAIGMRTRRIELAAVEQARTHPAMLVGGVIAIGVSVVIVRALRAEREERYTTWRYRLTARLVKALGVARSFGLARRIGGFFAARKFARARRAVGREIAVPAALRGIIRARAIERHLLPERVQAALLERRLGWLRP